MQLLKNFFIRRIQKKLIVGFSKRAGRNFFGRKTVFTQSGGIFKKYKIVDFFRVLSYNAILLTIEKDIYRTGYIGLIYYENGLTSYILLSQQFNKIGLLLKGFLNKFNYYSSTFLLNIFTGNFISHIEKKPGLGAKFVRAAGSSAFLVSKEGYYNFLKMNSGWILKISNYCVVILGMISNIDNNVIRIKNAGYNRRLGIRPRVRGVAMNPCDHPHGGGEGTGSPPRAHKTPWGKLAKVPTKRKKKFLIKKKLFKKNG